MHDGELGLNAFLSTPALRQHPGIFSHTNATVSYYARSIAVLPRLPLTSYQIPSPSPPVPSVPLRLNLALAVPAAMAMVIMLSAGEFMGMERFLGIY